MSLQICFAMVCNCLHGFLEITSTHMRHCIDKFLCADLYKKFLVSRWQQSLSHDNCAQNICWGDEILLKAFADACWSISQTSSQSFISEVHSLFFVWYTFTIVIHELYWPFINNLSCFTCEQHFQLLNIQITHCLIYLSIYYLNSFNLSFLLLGSFQLFIYYFQIIISTPLPAC